MDAAGVSRPQPTTARRLVPVRLGGSAVPALPVRQPAAIPVRVATPALPNTRGSASNRLGLGHQVLISLMVVGVIVGMVGSGTFASFNGVTKNALAITSGVLVLGDKVNTGSECFSAGGLAPSNPQTINSANSSSACTGVWNITTQTPGLAITPLQMTIRNAGNLTASALDIYAQTACADSWIGSGYNGGGSLCGQVQLEIEQYTSNTFGTPLSCLYGSTSGGLCLAEANKTPSNCTGSGCSYPFTDATHTLSNFGSTVTSAAPINAGALGNGGSAYFLVFANLPGTSGDSFQGRSAGLTFTWQITQ